MEPFGINEVAREIVSIWGEDAERICSQKAEHAERDGDQVQAAGWRRIRHAIRNGNRTGSQEPLRPSMLT